VVGMDSDAALTRRPSHARGWLGVACGTCPDEDNLMSAWAVRQTTLLDIVADCCDVL
jgi:hypothetical protein